MEEIGGPVGAVMVVGMLCLSIFFILVVYGIVIGR